MSKTHSTQKARPYFGEEFETFLVSNGATSGVGGGAAGILARVVTHAGKDDAGASVIEGGGGGSSSDGGGKLPSRESPRTPRALGLSSAFGGKKGKRPVMKAISPRTARNATLKQPLALDTKIAGFRAKIMKMRSDVDAASAKAEKERQKERDRILETRMAMAKLKSDREELLKEEQERQREDEKREHEGLQKGSKVRVVDSVASLSIGDEKDPRITAKAPTKASRKKQGLRDALSFAERVEADVHGNGSDERKGTNPIEDLGECRRLAYDAGTRRLPILLGVDARWGVELTNIESSTRLYAVSEMIFITNQTSRE